MLVTSSFDLWQRDAFFSAAEEVQQSADILESAYRTWVSEKRQGISSSDSDELLREVQTALGTAKWQLEEFERAVRLSHGSCRDQNGMARHQQFILAIESQITQVEDALRESLEVEGKEPLRWVNLDAGERDDLAMFLSGTHIREFTKNAQDEFAKSIINSKVENLYATEPLGYAACSSSGSVETNAQAKGLTSFGDDVVINIGPPNCAIEHTEIEALGTRGNVYYETDRASSTKRTWVSPKLSMLKIVVPNDDDQMTTLVPNVEATPKVKGCRTSSYLQLRAMNFFNELFKCLTALKNMMRSHRHLPFSSSMRLIILLTISFFLLVLYVFH